MNGFHVTFVVLFLAVIVIRSYYHFKARTWEGKGRSAEGPAMLVRIFVGMPLLLAIVLYLVQPQILNWSSFYLPRGWRWAGAAVFGVSVALLAWVQETLGRNFSHELRIRSDQTLVTSGPYRYVRHPMYSALFLMIIGMGLLAANWFIGAFGILFIFLLMFFRTPREEEMMVQAFGEQYPRYAETTGRFLPRLRTTRPRMTYKSSTTRIAPHDPQDHAHSR